MTTVLIPAAGESRRFREAGYAGPKALLPVDWRGVRQPAVLHLLDSVWSRHRWHTVVGTTTALAPQFAEVLRGRDAEVLDVGDSTCGQADTLLRMARLRREDDPAVVVNCDVVPNLSLWPLRAAIAPGGGCTAAVLVGQSESLSASYADAVPYFCGCVEKPASVPPGGWALLGVYALVSPRQLRVALDETLRSGERVGGEAYLSDALGRLPGQKLALACDPGVVLDWGTPAALAATGARIVG